MSQPAKKPRLVQDHQAVEVNIKNVTYLDEPVKFTCDKKDYRAIKLWNGLTALLISDTESETTENEEAGVTNETSNHATSSVADDQSVRIKPDPDGPMPVSKKKRIDRGKMAKCAISIGIGTFNDPPIIPGISQFLEQLVLMDFNGGPQNFTEFIENSGGCADSHTNSECTTFKFSVPNGFFLRALDGVVNCLFNPITRSNVIAQAERFQYGRHVSYNNVTSDELYAQSIRFRERYYRAHNMNVVLEAKMTLEDLETIVKECFLRLPDNPLPSHYLKDFKGVELLNITRSSMVYDVWSLNAVRKLELSWSIPPFHLSASKPHEYVSWIMEYRGEGSLFSNLAKSNGCLDISCGIGDFRSKRSFLTLTLLLTVQGRQNWRNILFMVYSYINLLRREGPKEVIHEEIRKLKESKVRFSDETRTIDLYDFCGNMRVNTPANFITGNSVSYEYDPISLKSLIDMLTPENGNIVIFHKSNNYEIDKVEPWFKAKYAERPVRPDLINLLKEAEPKPEFKLPDANVFLTDDYTVINAGPDELPPYPVKICDDSLSEIWYKLDTNTGMPKCCMNFYFISPLLLASPENSAMLDLFVEIVKTRFVEELYPATVAGLNYKIRSSDKGLIVEVDGFNQKLPLLIEKIITHIAECPNLITNETFETMKKEQLRSYYNYFMESDNLTNDLQLSLLRLVYWSSVDKHVALSGVNFESFVHFVKHFFDRLYVQCLVQGNMADIVVMQCVQQCIDVLKCKPLFANTEPHLRTIEIPRGIQCCRVKAFDPSWMSVLTNFYLFEVESVVLTVTIELLNIIANEPLFKEFRNQKSLHFEGYTQFTPVRGVSGVLGYSLAGNAREYIEEIDEILETARNSLRLALEEITDDELLRAKEALLRRKIKLQFESLDLKKEVESNWMKIISGSYDFDRQAREIEVMSEVSMEEVRDWMIPLTKSGHDLRKLSVQVLGTQDIPMVQAGANDGVPAYLGNHRLTHLAALPHETKEKPEGYFIMNIEDYKRRDGLFVFTPRRSCVRENNECADIHF